MKIKQEHLIAIAAIGLILIVANWEKIKQFLQKTPPATGADDTALNLSGGNTKQPSQPAGTGQVQVEAAKSYNSLPGSPSTTTTLQRGVTRSKSVYILQALLNYQFKKNLTLDGDFGGNTETALKSVFGKNYTTLSEFVNTKIPANSPAIGLLKQYGVNLTGFTGAYQPGPGNIWLPTW